MSSVRISTAAEPVLHFSRTHGNSVKHPIFDSNAAAVVFAASLGYNLMGRARPSPVPDTLITPNPVDLQIFKNGNLFPQILLIVLTVTKDTSIVRDEEKICGIIEDYAHVGFVELANIYDEYKEDNFVIEVSKRMLESLEDKI
jgi:hypothetical protein